MVPKLARPEFEIPIARIAGRVEEALFGLRSSGRAALWDEAIGATLTIAGSSSHLLRAQLVLLGHLAGGGGGEAERIERFAAGAELLHLFMLVHDDVMDNAQLRRGKKTVRAALSAAGPGLEWQASRDLAIVVGSVVQVLAMQHIMPGVGATANEVSAVELMLEGCRRAGAGQFQDLLGFGGLGEDEEALRNDLIDKAAFHGFAAPLAAGVRLAKGQTDPAPAIAWGCRVGLAFQAADDLADLVSSPAVTGKDSLRDLLEGRPSLPLFILRKRAIGADRALVDATLGRHQIEHSARARLTDLVVELGVASETASFVRAELAGAAEIAGASGYAPAALDGMGAIAQALGVYTDALVASVNED